MSDSINFPLSKEREGIHKGRLYKLTVDSFIYGSFSIVKVVEPQSLLMSHISKLQLDDWTVKEIESIKRDHVWKLYATIVVQNTFGSDAEKYELPDPTYMIALDNEDWYGPCKFLINGHVVEIVLEDYRYSIIDVEDNSYPIVHSGSNLPKA